MKTHVVETYSIDELTGPALDRAVANVLRISEDGNFDALCFAADCERDNLFGHRSKDKRRTFWALDSRRASFRAFVDGVVVSSGGDVRQIVEHLYQAIPVPTAFADLLAFAERDDVEIYAKASGDCVNGDIYTEAKEAGKVVEYVDRPDMARALEDLIRAAFDCIADTVDSENDYRGSREFAIEEARQMDLEFTAEGTVFNV